MVTEKVVNRINSKNQSGLEANIWKLYILDFLRAFMLFTPVMVLFFQENGLNMTQVFLLNSLYSIAIVLLEVPSGYFADRFGRRTSLILGSATYLTGISIYSLGTGFWEFLFAEMIVALSTSFNSGANSAMLYDTLEAVGRQQEFKQIKGNLSSLALVSAAIASVLGGLIADISLRLTFTGLIPVFVLGTAVAMTLKEPPRREKVVEKSHLREMISIGRETFLHRVKLRWLIIYSALIVLMIRGAYFLYQPYFKNAGIPVVYFGIIFAALNLVAAVSSKYAHRIEGFLGMKKSLVLLVAVSSTAFALFGAVTAVYGVLFALMHNFVRGFHEPVLSDYINKLIDSQDRSTVLSFKSLVSQLLYGLTSPLIGVVTDLYSIKIAMLGTALVTTVIGGTILAVLKMEKVI